MFHVKQPTFLASSTVAVMTRDWRTVERLLQDVAKLPEFTG
jgi:hypothetical protein